MRQTTEMINVSSVQITRQHFGKQQSPPAANSPFLGSFSCFVAQCRQCTESVITNVGVDVDASRGEFFQRGQLHLHLANRQHHYRFVFKNNLLSLNRRHATQALDRLRDRLRCRRRHLQRRRWLPTICFCAYWSFLATTPQLDVQRETERLKTHQRQKRCEQTTQRCHIKRLCSTNAVAFRAAQFRDARRFDYTHNEQRRRNAHAVGHVIGGDELQ